MIIRDKIEPNSTPRRAFQEHRPQPRPKSFNPETFSKIKLRSCFPGPCKSVRRRLLTYEGGGESALVARTLGARAGEPDAGGELQRTDGGDGGGGAEAFP